MHYSIRPRLEQLAYTDKYVLDETPIVMGRLRTALAEAGKDISDIVMGAESKGILRYFFRKKEVPLSDIAILFTYDHTTDPYTANIGLLCFDDSPEVLEPDTLQKTQRQIDAANKLKNIQRSKRAQIMLPKLSKERKAAQKTKPYKAEEILYHWEPSKIWREACTRSQIFNIDLLEKINLHYLVINRLSIGVKSNPFAQIVTKIKKEEAKEEFEDDDDTNFDTTFDLQAELKRLRNINFKL